MPGAVFPRFVGRSVKRSRVESRLERAGRAAGPLPRMRTPATGPEPGALGTDMLLSSRGPGRTLLSHPARPTRALEVAVSPTLAVSCSPVPPPWPFSAHLTLPYLLQVILHFSSAFSPRCSRHSVFARALFPVILPALFTSLLTTVV